MGRAVLSESDRDDGLPAAADGTGKSPAAHAVRRAGAGFAFTHGEFTTDAECVAKWGNWHCGENKERFTGTWTAKEPTLFEPFVTGEAVRIVIVGKPRQIHMTGKGWLKSVHGEGTAFVPADPELVADTEAVRRGLGLDIIANDYIVGESGPYLLEVNHIPSVTCFPELWEGVSGRCHCLGERGRLAP